MQAILQILPINAGGRYHPIVSGYRSLIRFEGIERDFGFELQLDSGSLVPGETGIGRISLWAAEGLSEISVGHEFQLREGSRVVGLGKVLEPVWEQSRLRA